MPRLDGIAATRALTRIEPPPAVLVVTTFDLDEYVYGALRAGATGFLLKNAPEDALLAALRTAHHGVSLFSPAVTRRLVEMYAPPTATPSQQGRLDRLTEREAEVLRLVAASASNAEIAAALVIGEATVKTTVSRLLMKLGWPAAPRLWSSPTKQESSNPGHHQLRQQRRNDRRPHATTRPKRTWPALTGQDPEPSNQLVCRRAHTFAPLRSLPRHHRCSCIGARVNQASSHWPTSDSNHSLVSIW